FVAAAGATLMALAQQAATRQIDPMAVTSRAVAVLTRMIDDGWHPIPTDPVWSDIRPVIDAELAERPVGPIAMLARRAAARVDVYVEPVVSSSADISSLRIDARPWFATSTDLPYVVEVRGALD